MLTYMWKGKRGLGRWGVGLLVTLVVTLAALAGFFGWKYLSQSSDEKESAKVLEHVKSIYLVPVNETPTVAVIQDTGQLQDQPFFKDAQKGDYLLVYSDSALALLYRNEVGKLVNVGPISVPAAGTGKP